MKSVTNSCFKSSKWPDFRVKDRLARCGRQNLPGGGLSRPTVDYEYRHQMLDGKWMRAFLLMVLLLVHAVPCWAAGQRPFVVRPGFASVNVTDSFEIAVE